LEKAAKGAALDGVKKYKGGEKPSRRKCAHHKIHEREGSIGKEEHVDPLNLSSSVSAAEAEKRGATGGTRGAAGQRGHDSVGEVGERTLEERMRVGQTR